MEWTMPCAFWLQMVWIHVSLVVITIYITKLNFVEYPDLVSHGPGNVGPHNLTNLKYRLNKPLRKDVSVFR